MIPLKRDVDLPILDVAMPCMTGLHAARELKRRRLEIRVLMLPTHENELSPMARSFPSDASPSLSNICSTPTATGSAAGWPASTKHLRTCSATSQSLKTTTPTAGCCAGTTIGAAVLSLRVRPTASLPSTISGARGSPDRAAR